MRAKQISVLIILVIPFLLLIGAASEDVSKNNIDHPLYKKAEQALIPGGEFIMGRDRSKQLKDGRKRYTDNIPHKVYVGSFYMDKYEVTNYQYYVYCMKTGVKLPDLWGMRVYRCGLDFPNHPVVGIPHYAAKKYAQWVGMRLPTEAEWEYAARGGLAGMPYPLGDKQERKDANFGRRYISTSSVGSFKPNGYGLYDMSGNVVEWVADWYDKDYYKISPYKNPNGPELGLFKSIRGGGWFSGPMCSRVFDRNGLKSNWIDFNVGFRCARSLK